MDKNLLERVIKPVFGPDEISSIVKRVASEIRSGCGESPPILVGVLKGAFLFLSDLVRELDIPHEVDFIQTACYGTRDVPSNEVLVLRDITADLRGREVVIVEDIIDRGHTARVLVEYFSNKGASSISLCTFLLRKGGAPGLKVDYVGAAIDEGFVVGYGMDYKERYRGLPGLYMLEP